MKDIKTYINELEIKKETIKSIKLIDLLSLFEDKKQYIEIYSIGFGEEDLEKIEKYKGIVDMDLLITKSFIDKEVKVVKSSYDFENNLNIKNIFLSLINKL